MRSIKISLLIFLFSFAAAFFVFQIKPTVFLHANQRIALVDKPDSVLTLKLSVVGDLMCHSPQFNSAKIAETDSFDFRPVFSVIRRNLENSDYTIGNLETVISANNKHLSGYPNFNSPHEFLSALKYAGFDILFTANNHSLDKGLKGAIRTINQIKQNNMVQVGTYVSQKDRDSIRIFEKNGIRFALFAYTFGTNGHTVSKQKRFIISLIDKAQIRNDLQQANKLLPDLVIIYFHFGNEYQAKPSAFQKDIVNAAIKSGADIVLGSHPHVLQPIKKFKSVSGRIDSGFVAYSLGNFISNQRWRYSDAGGILNILIKKNIKNDSVFISKIKLLPTWVFKGNVNGKTLFQILPSEITSDTLQFLSSDDIKKMQNSFYDAEKIITSEDSSILIQHILKQ